MSSAFISHCITDEGSNALNLLEKADWVQSFCSLQTYSEIKVGQVFMTLNVSNSAWADVYVIIYSVGPVMYRGYVARGYGILHAKPAMSNVLIPIVNPDYSTTTATVLNFTSSAITCTAIDSVSSSYAGDPFGIHADFAFFL